MNVLFITLCGFESISERNIYTDLLREFAKNGHCVYAISPAEKRENVSTHTIKEGNTTILRLQIGNIQKTGSIKKGINTILLESRLTKAIKKYYADIRFDFILYSTPPITLVEPVRYVKKRDGARTYLLLKDIFPQNAVDIEIMKTSGLKGLLYKYFRKKEKRLYEISDRIGCMSQANVKYILDHNTELRGKNVEVCPNGLEIIDKSVDEVERKRIRNKYKIPLDKTVFVYGGNLGKPQGVEYIVECLKECESVKGAYFLIVGSGTEFGRLEDYVNKTKKHSDVRLMKALPRDDYDTLVGACDVGLIFLDHRFTIPNFPSRLLSYMQAKLPVLACTDPNTDIGEVITAGEYGWWCESDDVIKMRNYVEEIVNMDKTMIIRKGYQAYKYMIENFDVSRVYRIITQARN